MARPAEHRQAPVRLVVDLQVAASATVGTLSARLRHEGPPQAPTAMGRGSTESPRRAATGRTGSGHPTDRSWSSRRTTTAAPRTGSAPTYTSSTPTAAAYGSS